MLASKRLRTCLWLFPALVALLAGGALLAAGQDEEPRQKPGEVERFGGFVGLTDFHTRRAAANTETIARMEAFAAQLEKTLAEARRREPAEEHSYLVSSISLRLYLAHARLEGARVQLWQARTALELGPMLKDPEAEVDRALAQYMTGLRAERMRADEALAAQVERLDSSITDERLRKEFAIHQRRQAR